MPANIKHGFTIDQVLSIEANDAKRVKHKWGMSAGLTDESQSVDARQLKEKKVSRSCVCTLIQREETDEGTEEGGN